MGGEFSFILSLVACFDQWFVLCVEDLQNPSNLLFVCFRIFSRSLSQRIIKAVLAWDQ